MRRRGFLAWLRGPADAHRPSTAHEEIDEELRFHVEKRRESLERDGLGPDEAEACALERFGDLDAIRRDLLRHIQRRERRAGMTRWLTDVRGDLKMAARALRKSPGFTALVVVTLGLGIAVNTTIFSLLNPYLLRPLPFTDAGELVQLHHVDPVSGWDEARHSMAQYEDWKARSRAFEDIGAYHYGTSNLTGPEGPERVQLSSLTGNLFGLLGVDAMMGWTFVEAEAGPGGADVVVLGHGLWQRRYAGDPAILGSAVTIDGRAHTVIGVMPPEFVFPFGGVRLWTPIRTDAGTEARNASGHILVGRLNEGWTAERARDELAAVHQELSAEHPEADGRFSGVNVVGLREALNFAYEIMRIGFAALIAAVGFVLLIACVNVASLTLARSSGRTRDVAIRAALGAGRARIARYLLTESALLPAAGGVLGVSLAYFAVSALGDALPEDLYRVGDASIDPLVLAFTVALTLLTPVLFGFAPAFQASRVSMVSALKEGTGGAGAGTAAVRVRRALVVAEVALAVVLITGAGLMVRSVVALRATDLGLEPAGLLTARVSPPAETYPGTEGVRDYYQRAEEALRGIPGVRAVASVTPVPLNHETFTTQFAVGADAGRPAEEWPAATYTRVSPGYFEAMGISVVAGEGFDLGHTEDGAPAVVVNDVVAARYYPGEGAVGRSFLLGRGDRAVEATIVGVVEDVRHAALDEPAGPEIYRPQAQSPLRERHLVSRLDGDPSAAVAAVRSALLGVDPDLPVIVRPMADLVAENALQWSAVSTMLGVFGFVALLLATLGVYGLISYTVARRRTEIGIRIALGASGSDVRRAVVRDGLLLTVTGAGIGLVLALLMSELMTSLLFGVGRFDPVTLAAVVGVFLAVAFVASAVPASRAGRIDPRTALAAD